MNEELENKLWGLLQGSLMGLALVLSGYLFYQIFLAGHPNLVPRQINFDAADSVLVPSQHRVTKTDWSGNFSDEALAIREEPEDSQSLSESREAVSGQYPGEGSFLKNGRSWDEYQNQIQKRDLFKASLEEKKNSQAQSGAYLSELTKDLKLVGILLDQHPQAMIKDLKTNQTMFLNQGQQIDGATVADILEGKVILNYQDQRVELVQ